MSKITDPRIEDLFEEIRDLKKRIENIEFWIEGHKGWHNIIKKEKEA